MTLTSKIGEFSTPIDPLSAHRDKTKKHLNSITPIVDTESIQYPSVESVRALDFCAKLIMTFRRGRTSLYRKKIRLSRQFNMFIDRDLECVYISCLTEISVTGAPKKFFVNFNVYISIVIPTVRKSTCPLRSFVYHNL